MPRSLLVHIGCGLSVSEQWINYDCSPTLRISKIPLIGPSLVRFVGGPAWPREVQYGDIVKGLKIEENSCRLIFSSHMLEHLNLQDFYTALKNIYSYLEPNGTFRAIVPDLEQHITDYYRSTKDSNKKSNASIEFIRNVHLGAEASRSSIMNRLREAFGNSRHQWLWDFDSLSSALKERGFRNVRRHKYGEWSDDLFRLVEEPSRHGKSICVEATK